jgi:hypothetical protein
MVAANIPSKIIPNFFERIKRNCNGNFLVLHPIFPNAKISKEIGQKHH